MTREEKQVFGKLVSDASVLVNMGYSMSWQEWEEMLGRCREMLNRETVEHESRRGVIGLEELCKDAALRIAGIKGILTNLGGMIDGVEARLDEIAAWHGRKR